MRVKLLESLHDQDIFLHRQDLYNLDQDSHRKLDKHEYRNAVLLYLIEKMVVMMEVGLPKLCHSALMMGQLCLKNYR